MWYLRLVIAPFYFIICGTVGLSIMFGPFVAADLIDDVAWKISSMAALLLVLPILIAIGFSVIIHGLEFYEKSF